MTRPLADADPRPIGFIVVAVGLVAATRMLFRHHYSDAAIFLVMSTMLGIEISPLFRRSRTARLTVAALGLFVIASILWDFVH
jgi:hypothetical protein